MAQTKLLIIDDNPNNLSIVVGYLEESDYQVMVARSGELGLKRAIYGQPELILLDVQMPGMNGFETCRRLKADPKTQAIPIIFLTALHSAKDKVTGFEAGGVDYVTKPIEPTELMARINTHLTLRRLQTELEQTNKQLEQRVSDRTLRLQVQATISQYLNQIREVAPLLSAIVTELRDKFRYDLVQIYLTEPSSDAIRAEAFRGPDNYQPVLQKMGEGIVGHVAQSCQPTLCNDVANHPHYRADLTPPQTRSELVLPLHHDQQLVGILDVHSAAPDFFSDDDLHTLQSIAHEIVIGINHARYLTEREVTIAKLRELDQAKNQFMAVINHELRTPLNGIIGSAEMLQEAFEDEMSPFVFERVGQIQESGNHLQRLIEDILNITAIQSGGVKINLTRLDSIVPLLENVQENLKFGLGNADVTVNLDLPPSIPSVIADETRLRQILLNLGNNAAKFTEQGSITFQVKVQKQFLRMAVIDTGVGIPPTEQQAIFEAFQQIDMSPTREHGGLGLGLALSKYLVQLHHGEIGVFSQEGVGSEFYFTIPLA